MQNTFVNKLLMMILLGFFAACLLWGLRHIVNEALFESSGEGWKEMFIKKPARPTR